jgi:ATP-dependent Lon protease
VPEENVKDTRELPQEVLDKVEIRPLVTAADAVDAALIA